MKYLCKIQLSWFYQFFYRNIQSFGYFLKREERWVSFSSFKHANIITVNASLTCKFYLSKVLLFPFVSDNLPEFY